MAKFFKYNKYGYVITFITIVLIFIIDLFIPLGVAVGSLYVFPLYILFSYKKSKYLIFTSVICLILIILGYFLSPIHIIHSNFLVLANRIISMSIIIISTLILNRNIKLNLENKLIELKFKLLYNNSVNAMVTTDIQTGKIIHINKEALKLFGYKNKEEVDEKFISSNHYEDEETRNVVYDKIIKEEELKDYLVKMKKMNGSFMWVEISAKVFRKEGVIEGIFNNVSNRVVAEMALQKAFKEKDVLLNEIHHRVKNNLQIVWGMLDLQQHKTKNKEIIKILEESKLRIKTIGLLYEEIYKSSDFTNINMKSYIGQLINYLNSIYYRNDKEIRIINEVKNISFNIDISIPLSLIISEIISNSFKYAFQKTNTGSIIIKGVKNNIGKYELILCDDGCGFDKMLVYDTIGIRLIKNLCDQIGADLEIISNINKGTTYKIVLHE